MANYSYQFRKFKKTLQKCNAWERFKENFYSNNSNPLIKTLKDFDEFIIKDLGNNIHLGVYLESAFIWSSTIEGDSFWRVIHLKDLGGWHND